MALPSTSPATFRREAFGGLLLIGDDMPTLGLNHYNLRVPRELMEQLRSFYCEAVGLTLGARPPFGSFGYWLYAGGQPILHLSETRPGEACDAGAVSSFDHAAFSCTGRIEFERRLARLGIAFETARVPGLGQIQLFIRDPAGNGVELNFAGEEN